MDRLYRVNIVAKTGNSSYIPIESFEANVLVFEHFSCWGNTTMLEYKLNMSNFDLLIAEWVKRSGIILYNEGALPKPVIPYV